MVHTNAHAPTHTRTRNTTYNSASQHLLLNCGTPLWCGREPAAGAFALNLILCARTYVHVCMKMCFWCEDMGWKFSVRMFECTCINYSQFVLVVYSLWIGFIISKVCEYVFFFFPRSGARYHSLNKHMPRYACICPAQCVMAAVTMTVPPCFLLCCKDSFWIKSDNKDNDDVSTALSRS
jgi:hypothetical protein